ncbi:hypothetical protein J9332_24350 [Aquimarina celericrescens]|nr:hypothetical protein [Aquimarina celericrescens]
MNQNRLPADSSAMTLGIIAVVITVAGCCCGLLAYVSLILSIVGLISANKSIKLYEFEPENYSPYSYNNVKNAKILNIVTIVVSGLISLFYTVYYLFYGALLSTMLFGLWENYDEIEKHNDAWEEDSIYYDESYDYEVEEYNEAETLEDTLVLDSLEF